VARDLRAHAIPCDVIHIDTDWYERDWECDLRFGPTKFPDPAGMISALRTQGFRVCLWQWPNMLVGSALYNEARDGGYLAKRSNGHAYTYPGFMADAGFIDYSNPAAVAWIQDKFRALFRQGAACIKADFGEGAPPDAVYHGVPRESMHNLYPLLYNQAVFAVTEEFWGEGQGIIWGRSAWAGSQRYPVHWSGDGIARYEDLPCVLRSALNFGLSGFPFYSHDIGGFSGLPSPDVYVRWAQFGLFSSHARAHGTPPREPWVYGAEAERIFRQYDNLRYRLLPYIYSEAVECGRSSLPMLRALALDFQDDPTALAIDDQYLFGPSILVAPILDERNRRAVYLPPGQWIDYWSKQTLDGGR
jgi:alpha-D-xyloside xylohydrolase